MNKQLTFSYKDKDYTLEYTKDTIRQMERNGFRPDELAEKPMTMLPDLFAGAFIKHHPTVKRSKVDELYGMMKDKSKLLQTLLEMYAEPVDALMDEGNLEWTPNWQSEEEAD